MNRDSSAKPSFSRGRRWTIGLNVAITALVVFAVVVMVNYFSSRYFQRAYLSTRTQVELHPPTLSLLRSITNQIKVTLYYNRGDDFYGDLVELLREYHSKNPNLAVQAVDFNRDFGIAQEVNSRYKLGSSTNLIIFDAGGDKVKVVPGNLLVDYTIESVPDDYPRKRPVQFKGEMLCSAALLAITSPNPYQAYFVEGHGEHRIEDAESSGFMTFASILQQNFIQVHPLTLIGTNQVPADCNLLVIPGPQNPFDDLELQKIEQYLSQGGRLLALFDFNTYKKPTRLEQLLRKWGISVAQDLAIDEPNTLRGRNVAIAAFSRHPLVKPLLGSYLYMTVPRPVDTVPVSAQTGDSSKAEVVAETGPAAYLLSNNTNHGRISVMAVVDKPSTRGVAPEGNATRMVVVGDSFFLANGQIEDYANRDFANLAANWLLDRTVLMPGLGPRPISDYKILIPDGQMQTIQIILLAGTPGIILLFGGLVWIRRRK